VNWLTPLCQEIVKDKRFSREQRDVAVLWAGELSALCDRWVPNAPIPAVQREPDDGAVVLSWIWKSQQRELSVYIGADQRVSLHMFDRERNHIDLTPTHELLKRSVQCFFEGWVPTNG